jgi:DNA-binding CsgD family transcriptional regulator
VIAALLLVDQVHAQLPIGLLVYDAESLKLVQVNATMLGLAPPELTPNEVIGLPNEEHGPQFPASELASALVEVAATGRPRHLPEIRHDFLGRGPRWWSASLHRFDTDRWGRVVVTLAADLTDQVHARNLLEEREERRLLLQHSIASVPVPDLMSSLQRVADALVAAFPVDAAALRLLDEDAKLHLVAASGLRPAETRHLAFEPISIRRLEAISESGRHPLVGSLGLRWVEIRWLRVRDGPIGALTIGAHRDRRLTEDDLALFDIAAAELGNRLELTERSSDFLLRRSLEVARTSMKEDEAGMAGVADLRPRELAILRLYAEGLKTQQIAEVLVLSVHTVRTHVKNARRRLGVASRGEALKRLKATDAEPVI